MVDSQCEDVSPANQRLGDSLAPSWFEFLLNPTQLEEHLSKENADPSATELIMQFLANAFPRQQTTFPPVTVLPSDKSESSDSPEESKENVFVTNKSIALKLLALKVAAFIKWDLNALQTKLPVPMQNTLLLYLLSVTLETEDSTNTKFHAESDLSVLSSQAFFAIILYHRWCSRMISPQAVCTKPVRTMALQLPGIQDPTFVPPSVIETIVKSVYEKLEDTVTVLEKSLKITHDIRIPSLQSFGTLSEDKQAVEFFWDEGTLVSKEEIICQTAFDLGCLYFFRREYSSAGKAIFKALELFKQLSTNVFCQVDENVLNGYCMALEGMLKNSEKSKSLLFRLGTAVCDNFEDIVPVLMEDNLNREIALAHREETLTNLHMLRSKLCPAAFSELYFKVLSLNVLRTVLDGKVFPHDYVKLLISKGEHGAVFLRDAVFHVLPHSDTSEKENVRNLIRYICSITHGVIPEISKVLNCSEIVGAPLDLSDETQLFKSGLSGEQIQCDFNGHTSLQLGELEVQLMSTYDPRLIYDLIPRIHAFGRRTPVWTVTKRWELQNPIHSLLMELPQNYKQEAIYIMLAKSRELAALKSYLKASRLLEVVDSEVSDSSFKLLRLVCWERLFMDLLHVRAIMNVQPPEENWVQDLTKQVKYCLAVFLQEKGSELAPRQEIIHECAIFILNSQQWDCLATVELPERNCLEFPCIVARMCSEIKGNKGGRKAIRELWDSVLAMFATSVGQNKRSLGGIPSLVTRESPFAVIPRYEFHRFFEKIKNKSVLSMFISLLSKVYNILKDDINSIISIDSTVTWPMVISNSSIYGIRLVQDTLMLLLRHSLSIFPVAVSWIKAKADLNYVIGQHANSLRFYLEAAMISSGYFADLVPRTVLDDLSLRRMIRCCSQLQCHTQAAVLCQFLDDIDYSTAFKALQEKNSQDAMDVYYPCIWDINILEFLIHIHSKRGETSKKDLALRLIAQLELNSNNNAEIQREASNVRKGRFMRSMVRQYL